MTRKPRLCDACQEHHARAVMPDGRYLCQRCYRWHSQTVYLTLLDQEYERQREHARTGRDPLEELPR